jgi:hypothetical protein
MLYEAFLDEANVQSINEDFSSDILKSLDLSKEDLKDPSKVSAALNKAKKLPKNEKNAKKVHNFVMGIIKWGIIGGIAGFAIGGLSIIFKLSPLVVQAAAVATMYTANTQNDKSDYKKLIEQCTIAKQKLEQVYKKTDDEKEKAKIKKSIADIEKSIDILDKADAKSLTGSVFESVIVDVFE